MLCISYVEIMHVAIVYGQVVGEQERRVNRSWAAQILSGLWPCIAKQPGVITFASLVSRYILQIDLQFVSDALCTARVRETAAHKESMPDNSTRRSWLGDEEEHIGSQSAQHNRHHQKPADDSDPQASPSL